MVRRSRRGKVKRKVCRKCKLIVDWNVQKCPNCGSEEFSEDWAGFILIVDAERSEIAKKKGLKEGMYAIKVF